MTYWQYWKLNSAPFALNGRSRAFFRGQSVEEALARIEFICSEKHSLATLIGSSGIGKSCLLQYLNSHPLRSSGTGLSRICCLSMIGLAGGELVFELARRLSGRRMQSVTEAWSNLSDSFSTGGRAGLKTLLLLDDVESCGADAENDLIRVVRAACDSEVSVVLAIEAHLASTVSPWLIERSDLQIELPLWEVDQVRSFLQFSLGQCGRYTPAFTDAAVSRLHELSRGTVRRLVQLADLSLVAGAVSQAERVDEGIVTHVANELPSQVAVAA